MSYQPLIAVPTPSGLEELIRKQGEKIEQLEKEVIRGEIIEPLTKRASKTPFTVSAVKNGLVILTISDEGLKTANLFAVVNGTHITTLRSNKALTEAVVFPMSFIVKAGFTWEWKEEEAGVKEVFSTYII